MPLLNTASLSTPQPSTLGKPSSRPETISQPWSRHPYNPRLYDYLRLHKNIVIYVLNCGCLFVQSHGIPHITGDPNVISTRTVSRSDTRLTRLNSHCNLQITHYIIGDSAQQSNEILRKTQHNITLHWPITNRSKSNPRHFSRQSAAQDWLTRPQPHRTSPDNRLSRRTHSPPASPDLHASLGNKLPRTDSLACSFARPLRNSRQPAAQDGLTRLQLHQITLPTFADRLPRHPKDSSQPLTTHHSWPSGPPTIQQPNTATLQLTGRKFTSQFII